MRKFEFQKRFSECRNKKPLPFDFYLPEFNCCIEYQGKQHFEPSNIRGKIDNKLSQIEAYMNAIFNDQIKENFCNKMNIRLIKISYRDLKKIESVLINTLI